MTKKGASFKLDDRHFEILETKSKQLGVGKSEYLRNLIDSNHKVQLNTKNDDLAISTENARNVNYNEITITILKALSREYDTNINKKTPLSSIRGFAKKYDFRFDIVKGVLEQLVRDDILITNKPKHGKINYEWTYLGLFAFPEYAPVDVDDKNLVSGSMIGALITMLGNYDDIVSYLSNILNIDQRIADSIVRFFLVNYVGYFTFLRSTIFPITGVEGEIIQNYYRIQMVDYLSLLISNSAYKWKDWKTNQVLDLKEIYQKILEFKKYESSLT